MASKIFTRSRLSRILRRSRGKRKIVFTNGCFDLFHPGHLLLLLKAKSLGDILIVAVNSDLSVRKLKGRHRPLIDEKSRARILSALSCVDYVTVFPEDTPAETIAVLRPDILVKGSDYKLSEIVGKKDVRKVVRFPLVKNFSTSGLIQKIVRAYGN